MNKKYRVMWLCNSILSEEKPNATGTWLYAMSEALINSGKIDLYNITQGKVNNTLRKDYGSIKQWVIPNTKQRKLRNGLPSKNVIKSIQGIFDYVKPDIIHVWGTEVYWGLLTARDYISGNTILEIQGLKYAIEEYYTAGLSVLDLLKSTGIREVIMPTSSIYGNKYNSKHWGEFEKEIIVCNQYISTQSGWSRAHIKNIHPEAKIYQTLIPLRVEYLRAEKWELDKSIFNQIFTLASATTPYKGLHVLIDAVAILKKRHPNIKLIVAGTFPKKGINKPGYTKWLERKITNSNLINNISFIGPLDAVEIIMQLKKARVFVQPSFVESYSLALDEALSIGTPTVVSFAGAMPERATDGYSALYFTPGDVVMCANAIERIINNTALAKMLSENAYNERNNKNNQDIAKLQIDIYKDVMQKTDGSDMGTT